jgi:indolepyruvate ferredoxin oxidoreductase beta subunit
MDRPEKPLELRIVIGGLGGQGVIYITRLLAKAAVDAGQSVLVSENHGMSQRGGSVVAHVKIGAGQAALIGRGTADLLIALDADEAARNLPFVRPGGAVVANAPAGLRPELAAPLARLGVAVHCLSADAEAAALGARSAANVVVLGYAAAQPALAPLGGALAAALERGASDPRAALNREAFAAGLAAGSAAQSAPAPAQTEVAVAATDDR